VDDQEHRRELEALYVRHERGLYNVAYRYVWNADDARDLVHDAFVRLWNKRARIDWERAPGLAYRTVLGLAANRRRTSSLRRILGATVTAPLQPALADQLDAARGDAAVRRAIDRLPERLRRVLTLCTFSELDHAAIGALLEIPAGTVGSRRTEAIARIRDAIAKERE
jgi:RNA polymerase sigma-70 factor (ECF subfamily)